MEILNLNKQPQEYDYALNPAPAASNIDYNDSNLGKILEWLQNEAIQKIQEFNYLEAISDLLHCEEILEAVTAKGELSNVDEVIVLLNNLAMCYQRIGEIDKALAYLDGSLYNFKLYASKHSVKNDIKMNSLISKISLQCCAMHSQKGQHKNAIKFAKNSQNLIETSCNSILKLFSKGYFSAKSEKKKGNFGLKSNLMISKKSGNLLKLLEKLLSGSQNTNKYKFEFPE